MNNKQQQAGVELSDDALIDLTCEHLVLTRRRKDTLIDPRTGRYTDHARYLALCRAAIAADRQQRGKMEPVACIQFNLVENALPEPKHYSSSYCGQWMSDWCLVLTAGEQAAITRMTISDSAKDELDAGKKPASPWMLADRTKVRAWAYVTEIEKVWAAPQAEKAPSVQAVAWMRDDGMKAMVDDEKQAWIESGHPDVVAEYTKSLTLAAPQQPSVPLKDHQIAQLVNDLADIARQYSQTQQLRERISQRVVAVIKAT